MLEYTNNTIIGSGNLDMLLSANGTLLAIQNMTWDGMQGLRAYPDNVFHVPHRPEYNGGSLVGAGRLGYWGSERGLTFYQVQLAEHGESLQKCLVAWKIKERLTSTGLPGHAPGAAYRMMELLLGRIELLSATGGFTTQAGNYSVAATI